MQSMQEWLKYGQDYLHSAQALLRVSGSAFTPIAHLAWQTVENDLKALAAGHSIPYTHDIGQIMRHLQDNGILSDPEIATIAPHAAAVTGSTTYNANRYPEHNPTYWNSTNTVNAVNAAEQIHYFVSRKLQIEIP